MDLRIVGLVVLCAGSCVSLPSVASASCERAALQRVTDLYVAAQAKGDPSMLPRTAPVKYVENGTDADLDKGILSKPLKIDFHRSLLDTGTCQSFTEVVVTDVAHPYVLGVRLQLDAGRVSEAEALVTDKHDWLFSARNDLKYSPHENWGVIPASARDDRKTLIAAANAYFDLFTDKSVQVPWGKPCNRLEGGLRTGKGQPDDRCDVGVPSGVTIADRHFVVDEEIGAVTGLVKFGKGGLPDSHTFRVENGKIRYVHTITHCTVDNCGFPLPAALKNEQ